MQQKVEDFQWRFQAFNTFKPKVKPKVLKAISPKLGQASIPDSFSNLVNDRPKVRIKNKQQIQDYSFDMDSLGFEKRAVLTGVGDMVDLMVKAGFDEISDTGLASKIQLATGKAVLQDLIKNGFDIAKDEIIPDVEMD